MFPLTFITGIILSQDEENLPSVSLLDNPPEYQASVIIAKTNGDQDTVIGQFWKVNRTSVKYREISSHVVDALISTEDERFHKHSGIDFRALLRAIKGLGSSGGASTITQQLAKQFYTLNDRKKDTKSLSKKFELVVIKLRENIIAKRLEERYTKEEILTFYLNQVDFLYNAVGIKSAAKIYFNKEPSELNILESATLVGMCKNPSLYNPLTYRIKDYRSSIAHNKKIKASKVSLSDIRSKRKKDSLRCVERRNQVLFQWLRNSSNRNEALKKYLTREEYDSLRKIPIAINYTTLDHKEGLAPYFRESLRKEAQSLLKKKDKNGKYIISKRDGAPYNIYTDGLKIYTTLDVSLQRHAEYAVQRYLKDTLQALFDKNNKNLKNFPFSDRTKKKAVLNILKRAKKQTDRYKGLRQLGYSEEEIEENFNKPIPMKVFSWKGEIDTIMSPNDSIKYYKSFLHAGLVSIDPKTGFIRAWVGGANFKHFAYDHAGQGKRQVGSTIKPFVYGMALQMNPGIVCKEFSEEDFEITTYGPTGKPYGRPYSPGDGHPKFNFADGLAASSNKATIAVLNNIGGQYNPSKGTGGPFVIASLLKDLGIDLKPTQIVPSMCLGVMDLSLLELTAAECVFPNNGKYISPTAIERIEDRNGRIIYSAEPEIKHAMNSSAAYETLKYMKGVVNRGTAASLRSRRSWGGIKYPTAGKTGTTDDNADGWFIGITPDLVTGVWVGAENKQIRWKYTSQGQGARTALPIYGYYMQKVYKDNSIEFSRGDFKEPDDYDKTLFDCEEEEEEDFDINERPW